MSNTSIKLFFFELVKRSTLETWITSWLALLILDSGRLYYSSCTVVWADMDSVSDLVVTGWAVLCCLFICSKEVISRCDRLLVWYFCLDKLSRLYLYFTVYCVPTHADTTAVNFVWHHWIITFTFQCNVVVGLQFVLVPETIDNNYRQYL